MSTDRKAARRGSGKTRAGVPQGARAAARGAARGPVQSAQPVQPCTTPACRRMKELFSDWHDHRLHWRTRRVLEAHLGACPPCRVFFESLVQTIVIVREWPGVDVPRAVHGHLRALLRERHERRRAPACRRGPGR